MEIGSVVDEAVEQNRGRRSAPYRGGVAQGYNRWGVCEMGLWNKIGAGVVPHIEEG